MPRRAVPLSLRPAGGGRTLRYVKNLVSFGTWQYYESLARLEREAKAHGCRTRIFREPDLGSDFYRQRIRHFADNRGFGYWCWKAHLVLRVLEAAREDEVFLYVDAGNTIVSSPDPLLVEAIRDPKGVVLFDNSDGAPRGSRWINRTWTRPQTFALMGCADQRFLDAPQANASYIAFRRTEFALRFFAEFAAQCDRYEVIADPAPGEALPDDFVDHRHDQSILSLLAARDGVRLLRDPSQWGNARRRARDYPQVFDHHRTSLASLLQDPQDVARMRGQDPDRLAAAGLRAAMMALKQERRRYAELQARHDALRASVAGTPPGD